MNNDYDARNIYPSPTDAEQKAAIGKKVILPLSGVISEFREGDGGAFAMVELDERWGLPVKDIGCDLEALIDADQGDIDQMKEFIRKIKDGEFDSFGDVAWAAKDINL